MKTSKMLDGRTSRENCCESAKRTGLVSVKSKNFRHVEKGNKSFRKDAISLLGSGLILLIVLMEEPFDKAKSRRYIKKATGFKDQKTVNKWLGRLEKAGLICESPEGWLVSCEKFLTSEVVEAFARANARKKVVVALVELREENYANITLLDVSRKTHLPPGVIEEDTHLLAEDHGLAVAAESSWRLDMSVDSERSEDDEKV